MSDQPLDLAMLRRVAEAAKDPGGPWWHISEPGVKALMFRNDRAFIAEWLPAVAVALLDRLERAEAALTEGRVP